MLHGWLTEGKTRKLPSKHNWDYSLGLWDSQSLCSANQKRPKSGSSFKKHEKRIYFYFWRCRVWTLKLPRLPLHTCKLLSKTCGWLWNSWPQSFHIAYGWETTLTTISPAVHRVDLGRKRKHRVNEDISPHRKAKLEFLHFKAVCFQRTSSDLHWTRSSFLHAAYVLVGFLKVSLSQSRLWLLCCFMWLPWNGKPEASFQLSVAGPATRCWR